MDLVYTTVRTTLTSLKLALEGLATKQTPMHGALKYLKMHYGWLGVINREAGEKAARLWCTFDGTNWSEMVGPSSLYASEGSGNLNNRGIRTLDMYRGKL